MKNQKKRSRLRDDFALVKKSGWFDVKWYRQRYMSHSLRGKHPILHYLHKGWKKGYAPSAQFDPVFYLNNNRDVAEAGMCPLIHYLRHGHEEGRMVQALEFQEKSCIKRNFRILRPLYRLAYHRQITAHKGIRIAVHLHLYYLGLWREIKPYLQNLKAYNFTLFVTYTRDFPEELRREILELCPSVRFICVPNKGFDVGAFVEVLHRIELDDYDIIFKIHTKRDVIPRVYYGSYMEGSEWRRFLLDGILGPRTVHKTIALLSCRNTRIGMVATARCITKVDGVYQREQVLRAMNECGFSSPVDYRYVAGTMFAVRAEALSELKKCVSPAHFKESARSIFSMAHCMERAVCLSLLARGWKMYGMHLMIFPSPLRLLRQVRYKAKQPEPVLCPDMTLPYSFIEVRVKRQGRKIFLSSLLKEKDAALYQALAGNHGEGQQSVQPVDPATMKHAQLLYKLVNERIVAIKESTFETTYFRLLGNRVGVEKLSRFHRKLRIQIYDQKFSYILHGQYLRDVLARAMNRGDLHELCLTLFPYTQDVVGRFMSRCNGRLLPEAWDAVPRNVIIDDEGKYQYFDLNIKYLPGVTLPYFLYRVAVNLYQMAQEMQQPVQNCRKLRKYIYRELCTLHRVPCVPQKMHRLEVYVQNIIHAKQLGIFCRFKERIIHFLYHMPPLRARS